MKARLCVTGAAAMVEFCGEHSIAHEVCGKVIVATHESELAGLEELRRRGEANGLAGLRLIGAEELREIEPHASGLQSPGRTHRLESRTTRPCAGNMPS